MQKECVICGILFNTDNKNRKYCDDCSSHTRARRDEYRRALSRSFWRTYEPKLHHGVCAQCKKEFKYPQDLFYRSELMDRLQGDLEFCSNRCISDWRHERGLCTTCGGPIDESSNFLPDDLLGRKFCSTRCKSKYMQREKLTLTSLRKCIVCGEAFLARDGLFCGKRCQKKWQNTRAGDPSQDSNAIGDVLVRRERCDVCGKWTNSYHMLPQDYDYRFPPCACSKKCRTILEERINSAEEEAQGGDAR